MESSFNNVAAAAAAATQQTQIDSTLIKMILNLKFLFCFQMV